MPSPLSSRNDGSRARAASPLLRVVVVGSGSPLFQAVARAVAHRAHLISLVLPAPPTGLLRRLRERLRRASLRRSLNAPTLAWSDGVAGSLEALSADLLIVASFPHILPAEIVAAHPRGVLNVHMSLLPRHRGPDPIFWTYWRDDPVAGVTVHEISDRVDAGPILSQHTVPLARGRPSVDLYMELARSGAALAGHAVEAFGDATLEPRPQDESQASYESRRDRLGLSIPLADWSAETVWHVLGGLGDQHHDLIRDPEGRVVPHGRPLAAPAPGGAGDGRIEIRPGNCRLHCRDGLIEVARHGSGAL